MQETDHIVQLLKFYVQGELSPAQEAELRKWAGSDAAYQTLLDRVSKGESLQAMLRMRYELDQQETTDYLETLKEKVSTRIAAGQRTARLLWLRRLLPYAAAVLVMATAATWIFLGTDVTPQSATGRAEAEDIQPGGNRATLTLSDGRRIDLSEVQAGIVVGNEGITYNDGAAVVAITAAGLPESALLELSTPERGTYQITLSDGTSVWLNSGSTLKYPTRFDKHERVVELIGEAYFDVTQLRGSSTVPEVPFKVVSAGQTVEVLGTEFNIAAYGDEPETKTTLVEGVVQIVSHVSREVKRLKPGDQLINRAGIITTKRVDATQFTAWKDGFFYFDELAPEIAFTQLERWYGIEVVYQGSIPKVGFFGMIDRSKPLSAVLKTLAKSGLKFDVEQVAGKSRMTILDE